MKRELSRRQLHDVRVGVYSPMRSIGFFPFSVWLLVLAPLVSPAIGQKIKIRGGTPRLAVRTATPGHNPPPATDASTTMRLRERREGAFKITVSTTAPGQRYELRVKAMDLNNGVSQGEVRLIDGMVPVDLIRRFDLCDKPGGGPRGRGPAGGGSQRGGSPRGGPPCREEVTLRYRTFVTATDGSGTDSHTVRYTILAE